MVSMILMVAVWRYLPTTAPTADVSSMFMPSSVVPSKLPRGQISTLHHFYSPDDLRCLRLFVRASGRLILESASNFDEGYSLQHALRRCFYSKASRWSAVSFEHRAKKNSVMQSKSGQIRRAIGGKKVEKVEAVSVSKDTQTCLRAWAA